jgi:hypothetical protein
MKEEPASESAAAVVPTASRMSRSLRPWLIAADASAATVRAVAGDLRGDEGSGTLGGGGGGEVKPGGRKGVVGCWAGLGCVGELWDPDDFFDLKQARVIWA